MNSPSLSLIFVTAFCLILLTCFAFIFIFQKNLTPEEIVEKYTNTYGTPTAITLAPKGDDLFLNLLYDPTNNKWFERIEDKAYTLDGTTFRIEPHGKIVNEDEKGYEIQGVGKKLECPEPFYWDGVDCVLKNLCGSVEEYRGIPYAYKTQYDDKTQNQMKDQQKFHQKLYVKCPENIRMNCDQNFIFVGTETVDIKSNPCVLFDICSVKTNGFRHRLPVQGNQLDDREFYICNAGKSELNRCGEGMKFDELKLICMSESCNEGERVRGDENSFFICKNGFFQKVDCEFGVNETGVFCMPDMCIGYPKKEFYEDPFGGVFKYSTCFKNIITDIKADPGETTVSLPNLPKFSYPQFMLNDQNVSVDRKIQERFCYYKVEDGINASIQGAIELGYFEGSYKTETEEFENVFIFNNLPTGFVVLDDPTGLIAYKDKTDHNKRHLLGVSVDDIRKLYFKKESDQTFLFISTPNRRNYKMQIKINNPHLFSPFVSIPETGLFILLEGMLSYNEDEITRTHYSDILEIVDGTREDEEILKQMDAYIDNLLPSVILVKILDKAVSTHMTQGVFAIENLDIYMISNDKAIVNSKQINRCKNC